MPDILLDPYWLIPLVAIFGLAVGSFLNVVIHRVPKMMERQWRAECAEWSGQPAPAAETYNLVTPRSRCPACNHKIGALENIPLVSFIALRGKCAGCGKPISWRYPVVEALTAVLSGFAAWHFGPTMQGAAALLFTWAMIALAFIDLDTFFLPDDLTFPLLWTGLLLNIGATFVDLPSAVIGAAAGYLVLWAVFWTYKLATGKEGMGYGDFKLLAAIGAWLGWKMLPLVILLSSVVGAIIGIALIIFARRGRNVPIPFGPYLAIAGWVALFYGDAITSHYLELL
ncbi:MAG TPA: A24 family peptidase [Burkholderiales bacterium]|nr:A24 family peptidase [Burkholderiales bacterium]